MVEGLKEIMDYALICYVAMAPFNLDAGIYLAKNVWGLIKGVGQKGLEKKISPTTII